MSPPPVSAPQCDRILLRPLRARRRDGSISITLVRRALGRRTRPLCRAESMSPSGQSSTSWPLTRNMPAIRTTLTQPAAVQRPEGVLNAATFWIESDNLQSILIQNTGTGTPAGFLAKKSSSTTTTKSPARLDRSIWSSTASCDRGRDADRGRRARRAGRRETTFDAVHRQQHDQRLPADRRVQSSSRPPPSPPSFRRRLAPTNQIDADRTTNSAATDVRSENFDRRHQDGRPKSAETTRSQPPQPLFDTSGRWATEGTSTSRFRAAAIPALMEGDGAMRGRGGPTCAAIKGDSQ